MTAASSVFELALEPLEVLDVEVVRRLVEEEQVGAPGESPRERGARQLAARERAERPVEVVVREPEPANGGGRVVAPRPAAGVLEPRLRIGVAPKRLLVVRASGHRLLESPELAFELEQVARAGERVLAQRDVVLERGALVVERDPRALREGQLPALDRRLARDRAQERRLPRAVRACEREPVLAPDRERHVLEERVACELLAQLGCNEDGHGRPRVEGAGGGLGRVHGLRRRARARPLRCARRRCPRPRGTPPACRISASREPRVARRAEARRCPRARRRRRLRARPRPSGPRP